jgi:hypothetical protein
VCDGAAAAAGDQRRAERREQGECDDEHAFETTTLVHAK